MKTSPIHKRFTRLLSLLLTSLLMAFIVWAIAINAIDPMERRLYPTPVPVQVTNLDEKLALTDFHAPEVQLVITAPRSSWTTLINNPKLIMAYVDFNGLTAGEAEAEIKTRIGLPAVRVETIAPRTVHVRIVQIVA
jgi:hypothetical protein